MTLISTEDAVKRLEDLAYGSIHLTKGVDRRVAVKHWERGDKSRDYLKVYCYSLAGNPKGTYDCGYVDCNSGEYVPGYYDLVEDDTDPSKLRRW